MSLVISLPVIGLDQLLRTPAANFQAQPGIEIEHWITDSLMAVPFFFAGVWAADRIAGRARIGTAKRADLLKRSLIIALLSGLALAPVWYEINKIYNPIVAQPLVFPQAHDSGDVYSADPGVIVALVCVCLVPAAFWAGRAITRAATRPAVMRAVVPVLLAAAVPLLAWLTYQAAGDAYASQVYYARAPLAAARRLRPVHGPATPSHLGPAPRLTAAPGAFASQAAHALQDGFAGQAAGLPAAALTVAALRRSKITKTVKTPGPAAGTP